MRLVNARHVKNVSGRKSDVLDCQWIQRLHSYGLLNASFRPADQICVLRSYLRYRDELVSARSVQCQHMQKALQQMNVQLHQVLSEITGASGLRIIEAILAGERSVQTLAALADRRVRASKATIQKALRGDYRAEHLFVLQSAFDLHGTYKRKSIRAMSKSLPRWPNCLTASIPQKRPCHRARLADSLAATWWPERTCGRNFTAALELI